MNNAAEQTQIIATGTGYSGQIIRLEELAFTDQPKRFVVTSTGGTRTIAFERAAAERVFKASTF